MKTKTLLFIFVSLLFVACNTSQKANSQSIDTLNINYSNPNIKYSGRIDSTKTKATELYWSGNSIKINFEGESVEALIQDSIGKNYFNVIIDEDSIFTLKLNKEKQYYPLASNLSAGKHSIELFRRTELEFGKTIFYGFRVSGKAKILTKPATNKRKIEFYGNSITCGYANEDFSGKNRQDSIYTNNYLAYGALTARHFNAEYSCIAKGGIGIMVSWFDYIMPDIYDRTNPLDSTSKWDFTKYTPDIVVINLFQNDSWIVNMPNNEQFKKTFGKSKPSEEFIIDAYAQFLSSIRSKYPKANIICTLGSMNATKKGSLWPTYVSKAVKSLNDKKIYTHFFPFKGSNGHPLIDDHKVMAESLIEFINQNIEW